LALVVDTGVLYGTLNEADSRHAECESLLLDATETLVVPVPVLVELEYWLRKVASPEAWLAFCEDVDAGVYTLFALEAKQLVTAARLQVRYADLPLGLVDAAVFVTCAALGERKVATLDRRHFSILRTEDGRALEIVP
jgi:hypothetical protein